MSAELCVVPERLRVHPEAVVVKGQSPHGRGHLCKKLRRHAAEQAAVPSRVRESQVDGVILGVELLHDARLFVLRHQLQQTLEAQARSPQRVEASLPVLAHNVIQNVFRCAPAWMHLHSTQLNY